ncbi:hypothetical protein MMC07_008861 [Pseudocyphellaria aurata]|nr:hypothetical protein [Pseudocyphellaria aurata]
MASRIPPSQDESLVEDDALLDLAEAGEEIPDDPDRDMDSPDEDDDDDDIEQAHEIQLQNDSKAHFDLHTDSVFCIAQHPHDSSIVATGSGDDTTYVFDASPPSPLLPHSYESNPSTSRPSLPPLAKISGHTDSVNAVTYSLPRGDYLLTGGLDGRLRVHTTSDQHYGLLAEAQEVPEINFLSPCPHPSYPDTVALGASDGSVWVYRIDARDEGAPLQVVQAYYLHTGSCTAGAWTAEGSLLATVSEDGSLYVYDVFGEGASAAVTRSPSQPLVALTAEDQRFAVDGGLYCVAIAPGGAYVAVGGAGGMIRVVSLPRLGTISSAIQGRKGGGARNNKSGGKHTSGITESAGVGQAGQILASLQCQSDGVESLSFSAPPLSLLAAGSVDGSIALYDTAHRFAVRRHIRDAHEEYAVVKVEFCTEPGKGHLLTSCGMDGVVRRWDTRGGTAATAHGLAGQWRGHRGEGERGGVLGFIQSGRRIVTAGDDAVSMVFEDNMG